MSDQRPSVPWRFGVEREQSSSARLVSSSRHTIRLDNCGGTSKIVKSLRLPSSPFGTHLLWTCDSRTINGPCPHRRRQTPQVPDGGSRGRLARFVDSTTKRGFPVSYTH